MAERVVAPWSSEQVEGLAHHQFDPPAPGWDKHPYTCGNRKDGQHRYSAEGHDFGVLIPTPAGWVCLDCDYTQDWAHDATGVTSVRSDEPMFGFPANDRPEPPTTTKMAGNPNIRFDPASDCARCGRPITDRYVRFCSDLLHVDCFAVVNHRAWFARLRARIFGRSKSAVFGRTGEQQ